MADLDVRTALEILDALWSSDDPIWYQGKETTPDGLRDEPLDMSADARRIRIMFFGKHGRGIRRRQGTLHSMILDRLGGSTARGGGK